MDLKNVGQRIKVARDAKNLSQEDLAELVSLSPTHISVIERGVKAMGLDKFIAIANVLDISADALLVDVVNRSTLGVSNTLFDMIAELPLDEQKTILEIVRIYVESHKKLS